MGQKAGKCALKKKEIRDFVAATHFNEDEVKALFEHFKEISSTVADDGVIDKSEFQRALGFKDSVYLERMFQLFDDNNDGFINFEEFLEGLSILSTASSVREKIEISFKIYDMDGDGLIAKDELTRMLKTSLIESNLNMTDRQIAELAARTLSDAGTASPDAMDREEYRRYMERNPHLIADLTINVHGRIAEEFQRRRVTPGAAAAEGK